MSNRPGPRLHGDRLEDALRGVECALVIGIGGGGDVVGALDTALMLERRGIETMVGGVTWERQPIDPQPGPRRVDEIVGARAIGESVLVATANTQTKTGVAFAESRMAAFLKRDTLLVDPHAGPGQIARDLALAANEFGARLIVGVDVGGDVLAVGHEPGLGSPLCDAVLLAALADPALGSRRSLAAIFGPCCDGELTEVELLDRLAAVSAAGALLGIRRIEDESLPTLESAIEVVPTEASAKAVECARGGLGPSTIRGGRRTVPLSPLGATTFYFDPRIEIEQTAPLAHAVSAGRSLLDANAILNELGVSTELDWETDRALRLT